MSNFKIFAKQVNSRLTALQKNEMYATDVDSDELWSVYLSAFPADSDPIYKTNTTHTCSCCRNFVKNLGSAVAIIDGKIQTVWDNFDSLPYPYNIVSEAMSDYLKTKKVVSLYRSSEPQYGAEITRQQIEDGSFINWNHFYGKVDSKHFTKTPGAACGQFNTSLDVFIRGLNEITLESLDTVLDLIQSNNLYRGQEFKTKVSSFRDIKVKYDKIKFESEKRIFAITSMHQNISHFKNEVIGTLVYDLSTGVDIETAVKMFESKVAPANYKRPTALITPKMVESAMETIKDLDLEDALQRRFAVIEDVSVNNVLWVDNETKSKMKGGLEDLLMGSVKKTKVKEDAAVEMSIDEFVKDILPKASSVELLVKNSHATNFVSLTAPVHSDVARLFKWNNDFAWSYNGDIADSDIKAKVKKAGGNIDAKFRISLSWFNYDDLDLYVDTPKEKIYYCHKISRIHNGGLDVDMNAGGRHESRTPVENVSINTIPDGDYVISVNQYSRQETCDVGFVIEIECGNQIQQFTYEKSVTGAIKVATVTMKNGSIAGVKLNNSSVTAEGVSKDIWNIETESLVKVNTIMNSPNYWDDNAVGNKHWFFILEGCNNPEETRGIYNEFLRGDLEAHRKVFEVLGNKTKCPVAEKQLSGLGFSSTQKNSCTFVVKGDKIRKTVTVNF